MSCGRREKQAQASSNGSGLGLFDAGVLYNRKDIQLDKSSRQLEIYLELKGEVRTEDRHLRVINRQLAFKATGLKSLEEKL